MERRLHPVNGKLDRERRRRRQRAPWGRRSFPLCFSSPLVRQQPLFLLMNKTSEWRRSDSYFCWLRCEAAPGSALACLLTPRLACLSGVIGAVHQRAHKSNETLKESVLPAVAARPSVAARSHETRSPAHNGPRKLIHRHLPSAANHHLHLLLLLSLITLRQTSIVQSKNGNRNA